MYKAGICKVLLVNQELSCGLLWSRNGEQPRCCSNAHYHKGEMEALHCRFKHSFLDFTFVNNKFEKEYGYGDITIEGNNLHLA